MSEHSERSEGQRMSAVTVRQLVKRFRDFTALDDVSFDLPANTITGLLGRNGAGKTTLMRILTGQGLATAGEIQVLGGHPYENERVLHQVSFVRESQSYPQPYQVRHVLSAGALLYPTWDQQYAAELIDDFELPLRRPVGKLSRGQLSAVGIVVGLASRAPLTLFDEPYLGLDAVARQLFYDRLLADYAEHPRTVVLSTHLIDEVSDLIEHVLLLDHGRLVLDEPAEALRGRASTVTGPAAVVDRFVADREVLHREVLSSFARVTVLGAIGPAARDEARALGVDLEPVSLQQLIVRTTAHEGHVVDVDDEAREFSGQGAGASAGKGAER